MASPTKLFKINKTFQSRFSNHTVDAAITLAFLWGKLTSTFKDLTTKPISLRSALGSGSIIWHWYWVWP